MANHFSDDHCSVGHEVDFVDASADTEVDVRLPLEVDRRLDPLQKDVRTSPEVADEGAVDLNQQEQYLFEPPNGARSKWPRYELPLPNFLGSGTDRLGPGVVDRHTPELPSADRLSGSCHPPWEGCAELPGFPGPGGPWLSDETAGWARWAGLVSRRCIDGHRGPSAV